MWKGAKRNPALGRKSYLHKTTSTNSFNKLILNWALNYFLLTLRKVLEYRDDLRGSKSDVVTCLVSSTKKKTLTPWDITHRSTCIWEKWLWDSNYFLKKYFVFGNFLDCLYEPERWDGWMMGSLPASAGIKKKYIYKKILGWRPHVGFWRADVDWIASVPCSLCHHENDDSGIKAS